MPTDPTIKRLRAAEKEVAAARGARDKAILAAFKSGAETRREIAARFEVAYQHVQKLTAGVKPKTGAASSDKAGTPSSAKKP